MSLGWWVELANCQDTDPESFFMGEDQAAGPMPAAVFNTCAGCLVVQQCLNWALANDERYGVYGGTTPRERRTMTLGDPAPILLRARCACGALLSPRRTQCDDCHESRQNARARAKRARLSA